MRGFLGCITSLLGPSAPKTGEGNSILELPTLVGVQVGRTLHLEGFFYIKIINKTSFLAPQNTIVLISQPGVQKNLIG